MWIDNKRTNGQGATVNRIECIYTGRNDSGYIDRTDCQNNHSFNTEHTFPQTFFTSLEPMKSDLHHLFPTDNNANNQRGDNPFGVVSNPSWSNGGSLSNGTLFEPRDAQKGISARALFYFVLRYQNYSNFLDTQEAILRTWHYTFSPSAIERKRNDDIFTIQHNRNPFVDYPQFIDRITTISSNSSAPLVNSIDITQDTIIYGTVQPNIPAVFNFVIVNNGNGDILFSNFNLTHAAELSFVSGGNDTTISPGESLALKIQCLTTVTDSIRAFLTFNTNATGNNFVSVPIFVNDAIFSNVDEVYSRISVSPVPARENLTVTFPNRLEVLHYTLFDITGKKIISSVLNDSRAISLSNIKAGIYLLQISGKNGNVFRKVVVE
jgi:hypothetical protein